MPEKLFGSDGIRGLFGSFPINPEGFYKIGLALGRVLREEHSHSVCNVLVGRDTRSTGIILMDSLIAGLLERDCVVVELDHYAPTPVISKILLDGVYCGGVVITASHNDARYNGVKIFDHVGNKFSKIKRNKLEEYVQTHYTSLNSHESLSTGLPGSKKILLSDWEDLYVNKMVSEYEKVVNMRGTKVVLDCANGAYSRIASRIMEDLGAEVITFYNQPDGININKNCGSIYPSSIQSAVLQHKADIGFSFDGDGDRLCISGSHGVIWDTNHVIAALAMQQRSRNSLSGIVITVMTNGGFINWMEKEDIRFSVTAVGDSNISEIMKRFSFGLGGEPSGHIMCDGFCADALTAALFFMMSRKFWTNAKAIPLYKQVNINMECSLSDADLQNLRSKFLRIAHNEGGRLVMRQSGTEPVLRIMCENMSDDFAGGIASELMLIHKTQGIKLT